MSVLFPIPNNHSISLLSLVLREVQLGQPLKRLGHVMGFLAGTAEAEQYQRPSARTSS